MISPNYFWTCIIAISIGTFCIRFSFIAFSSRLKISDEMKTIFSFIPAAVLPALTAPMVFFHKGQIEALQGKERLMVFLLAVALCYKTRSMVLTILFGLGALFALSII